MHPPTRQRGLRLSILLVSACVAVFLATAGGQEYYPSGAGLSWTYSNGETQSLSGPREYAGSQVMVLTHYFQGVPVSEDYLLYGGEVRSIGTAAGGGTLDYAPALLVYPPAPLEVGQKWQSTARVADFDITLASEVIGVRGVQTPVGRFNALVIRQNTITSSGASTSLDMYFVPSVGVVRYVTQDGTVIDLIDKNF